VLVADGARGCAVEVVDLGRRCSIAPGRQQRLNQQRPCGQHHRDGPLHLGLDRPGAVVVVAAVAATPHGRSDAHL
jgi:hypothetical protein